MMNKYQFDKFIKSEVESIDFDGGLEAWEQFDASRTHTTQPTVSYFRRLRLPLAIAASVSVFCGLLLHKSLVESTDTFADEVLVNTVIANPQVQPVQSDEVSNASGQVSHQHTTHPVVAIETGQHTTPTPVIPQQRSLTAEVNQEHQSTRISEQIVPHQQEPVMSHPQYLAQSTAPQSHVKQSANISRVAQAYSEQSSSSPIATPERNLYTAVVPAVRLQSALYLPSLTTRDALVMHTQEHALDLLDNIVNIDKRKLKLFGELTVGNRNAGSQAIIGVAISNDSWSIETGIGLNQKGNKTRNYHDVVQSDIEDFEEVHRYTFAQRLNTIIPLRIRKRLGKRHAILVGVQGNYNLTNQVDIMSTVPVRTPSVGINAGGGFSESEVDFFDINYKYTNLNKVINSYALVSANRLNLDLTAGYELNFDRIALGVNVRRPVFSTFRVSRDATSLTRFQITEQTNVNLSLKYYLG